MNTKKKLRPRRPLKTLARIMVRPPSRPSDGAITVRQMFGDDARLVRQDRAPAQYRTVINWGNPNALEAAVGVEVLNKPEAVAKAINKLTAFQAMAEAYTVAMPQFTTETPAPTKMWLARTNLSGSGGAGIVVVRPEDLVVPPAPLYVEYIKKNAEYRVHVVNGQAIFAQMKKRRAGFEQDRDEKLIRNYENGWVFCIAPLEEVPTDVKTYAVAAVAALGLDFGAVDVITARETGSAYVLEVNTAPGIESPTLIEAYKQAFTALVA